MLQLHDLFKFIYMIELLTNFGINKQTFAYNWSKSDWHTFLAGSPNFCM